MFSKIRSALSGSSADTGASTSRHFTPSVKSCLSPKFPYSRPHFLALSEEQVQASADHRTRPIITPNHGMSFFTGYAECINAGKSKWNEDQAVSHHGVLKSGNFVMPYKFYALFDGHAGVGASICAANQMHHVVHERLVDTQDDIWLDFLDTPEPRRRNLLVIGALEAAFKDMDDIIKDDRATLQSSGGCTAIVAIFLLGQLYVANAGDSRAIVCRGYGFQALSTDFTPESDKSRIRQLAQTKPELLGNDFTYMEYIRQPRVNDLGKRILYRDAFMTGWAHKTIAPEDLKISIISGQGKRSRVMGTIGVTRGFGDHELVSVHQKVPIKPFLSCHPEVKVYNLTNCNSYDVLVMGTDGLWDVVDGHTVTQIVNYAVENFSRKEMCPTAAACLVGAARGSLKENCWMMKTGKLASVDDISVFVIPLYPCSHLTYKLRKQVPTGKESDSSLTENVNSTKDELPFCGISSACYYSVLQQPQTYVSTVMIAGIKLNEERKSEIVLQEENECEDEEAESTAEAEDLLSTDVEDDMEADENVISNRTSDQTIIITKKKDEYRRDSNVVQSLRGFPSSQTPVEPTDETSEDEFSPPDQHPHARRFKKDVMQERKVTKEKKRLKGKRIAGAEAQPSRRIENTSAFDYGIAGAQGDAPATLEKKYLYLSDRNLGDVQKRNENDACKKQILTETYESKSKFLVQQTTATEAIVTTVVNRGSPRIRRKKYDSSDTISEDTPPTPRRQIESSGSISEDTPPVPAPVPYRKYDSSGSISEDAVPPPQWKHDSSGSISEDTPPNPIPKSVVRMYPSQVPQSSDYTCRQERSPEHVRSMLLTEQLSFIHKTDITSRRMTELEIIEHLGKRQEIQQQSHTLPRKCISPPPQEVYPSYRQRTNSFPPYEIAKPGLTERQQQRFQCTPKPSHESGISLRKQEPISTPEATTAGRSRQTSFMPPEVAAAMEVIRAHSRQKPPEIDSAEEEIIPYRQKTIVIPSEEEIRARSRQRQFLPPGVAPIGEETRPRSRQILMPHEVAAAEEEIRKPKPFVIPPEIIAAEEEIRARSRQKLFKPPETAVVVEETRQLTIPSEEEIRARCRQFLPPGVAAPGQVVRPHFRPQVARVEEEIDAHSSRQRESFIPPEVAAVNEEIRTYSRQHPGVVKVVPTSRSQSQHSPKQELKEAKWEFYSDQKGDN